jgi:ATP-dependent RNA helicase DDX51/DBP6
MRKYIHRVGRTARAGRDGSAWSLVETQEARHFKSLLQSANHLEKVKKLKVEEEELEPLQPAYKVALMRLKDAFAHQ